eukprot:m.23446 g.23446  ORF g.23446 m.23446 type:complete len:218 (-) comp12939_c0_seq8:1111-1764(-)
MVTSLAHARPAVSHCSAVVLVVMFYTEHNAVDTGSGDGGGSGFLPKSGVLTIHVAQAKLAKNYGLMRMAPYVRVSQGTHVVSSPVSVHGAKHPFWNHTMNLFIPALTDLSVKVEVLSMGTFSDRLVGWTDISIIPALQGKRMENWFHLSGKQGVDKEGVLQLTMSFQRAQIQDFPRGATTPQPFGYTCRLHNTMHQLHSTTYFRFPKASDTSVSLPA